MLPKTQAERSLSSATSSIKCWRARVPCFFGPVLILPQLHPFPCVLPRHLGLVNILRIPVYSPRLNDVERNACAAHVSVAPPQRPAMSHGLMTLTRFAKLVLEQMGAHAHWDFPERPSVWSLCYTDVHVLQRLQEVSFLRLDTR